MPRMMKTLAALTFAILAAATARAALLPGVGYAVMPGAMSYAGTGHGHAAVQLDASADPWAGGGFNRQTMFLRYGPWWETGVPGPHSTDYATYLREAFASRTARWPVDYSLYDGEPSEKEVTDAYYTRDPRVLPLTSPTRPPRPLPTPTPGPTPAPEPAPTPIPGPSTGPCPSCPLCPLCPPEEPMPRFGCRITPLDARDAQTLRAAPTWTLVEKRKKYLRDLAEHLAAQQCQVYRIEPGEQAPR